MGKITLAESVADEISKYIQEQQLVEGQRIPNEYELSELLDVSRITVREAIKMLCTKGLIEVRRGVGTFVCNHTSTKEEFIDLSELADPEIAKQSFEVRCQLEPTIAFLAATRATPEDIVLLEEQVDTIKVKYQKYVDGQYSETDMCKFFIDHELAFHSHLASCAQNVFFERFMFYTMQCYLSDYWQASFAPQDLMFNLHHENIVKAIQKKDPELTRDVMVQHLKYTSHWAEHAAQRQSKQEVALNGIVEG